MSIAQWSDDAITTRHRLKAKYKEEVKALYNQTVASHFQKEASVRKDLLESHRVPPLHTSCEPSSKPPVVVNQVGQPINFQGQVIDTSDVLTSRIIRGDWYFAKGGCVGDVVPHPEGKAFRCRSRVAPADDVHVPAPTTFMSRNPDKFYVVRSSASSVMMGQRGVGKPAGNGEAPRATQSKEDAAQTTEQPRRRHHHHCHKHRHHADPSSDDAHAQGSARQPPSSPRTTFSQPTVSSMAKDAERAEIRQQVRLDRKLDSVEAQQTLSSRRPATAKADVHSNTLGAADRHRAAESSDRAVITASELAKFQALAAPPVRPSSAARVVSTRAAPFKPRDTPGLLV